MKKNQLVSEFELAVKQAAIDCELNKEANMDANTKYVCDKWGLY